MLTPEPASSPCQAPPGDNADHLAIEAWAWEPAARCPWHAGTRRTARRLDAAAAAVSPGPAAAASRRCWRPGCRRSGRRSRLTYLAPAVTFLL